MLSSGFQNKMNTSSKSHSSKIVLALDYIVKNRKKLFYKSLNILQLLSPYICAIKINYHLVLPLGLYPNIKKLVKNAHDLDLPVIMDCKINDIGHTNLEIARHYFKVGFDALTMNPFVGWKGGIEPVFQLAKKQGRGVIPLVYMSHQGAKEGYGQKIVDPQTGNERFQYIVFAEKALEWGADGVLVASTYPKKIWDVYQILQDKVPIYSPGIGIQGGTLRSAFKVGTSYFIVGRSILLSSDPLKSVKWFNKIINELKN